MNTRFFKYFLVFTVLMLGVNASLLAQEKEKSTLKKVEISNDKENEEKAMKLLEERMETASPEEKARMQKKLDAYYARKNEKGGVSEQERLALKQSKEQIQQAYFQKMESERKLEDAKMRIEQAENELNALEKEGKLTKEELELRRQKLEKAKEELEKSQIALKEQSEAIKAKRLELKKTKE